MENVKKGFEMRMLLVAMAAMLAAPAYADVDIGLARELGRILAFEEACDLSYDQNAIVTLIQDRVDGEDVSFNGLIDTAYGARQRDLRDISASMLTLQCTQIEQTARSFGFVD